MEESEVLLNLSDNLHYLLDGTGTIVDMAKRIGVDRTEFWRHMNCQAMPKTMTLIRLANELEVTVDWLITNHNHKGVRK